MPTLADQIAEAKANLERLEQQALSATCADLGHDWHSIGGCNCGCHADASCSVPVNTCRRCGDCDYGDNADANQKRVECMHREDRYFR